MTSPDTTHSDVDDASHYQRIRDRILLSAAALACFIVFWWIGAVFSVPRNYGYSASLLQQPAPVVVLLVAMVVFVICVVGATLITKVVRFEAGLYCAVIGLAALSIRGGPMRYTMMAANGPAVFLLLALELLLLYGIVFLGWLCTVVLRDLGMLQGEAARTPETNQDPIPSQGPLALVTQIVLMIFVMSLFSQSDKKAQALASVVIASFLATLGAQTMFPARPSIWFWIGPLIVGILGYLFAYFGESLWTNGEITGKFPSLAYPLPLDYAAAGPAGAILGYWTSRRWHNASEARAGESAASSEG